VADEWADREALEQVRARSQPAVGCGEAQGPQEGVERSLRSETISRELEGILAVRNADPDAVEATVGSAYDAVFTWDYAKGFRPALTRLYEKAKHSQWDVETDLDWSVDVDPARVSAADAEVNPFEGGADLSGTALEHWTAAEWNRYGIESQNWMLSQFLHGEQGALLCTSRIVESVPWIDAKYYAATQVMDEARHVEVFAKYLDTKLGGHYPVNPHLQLLLDDILADSRWDMTYLGMQIMVEGLALAAFGFLRSLTTEPLLKDLLRLVMADEARHVAFGVLSLKEQYADLTATELRERQEFCFEAAVRMRDRFLQQEVWERMGVDVRSAATVLAQSEERRAFQAMLFSKIVPNVKKLGLLDAGDGWLRRRFGELGVLQFEDWPGTDDEVDLAHLAVGS
jgi:hypothetical protein